MNTKFYLDDYNLIKIVNDNIILKDNILIYKNNKKINYTYSSKNNFLFLNIEDEYSDGDRFYVQIDDNKYYVIPRFITHTKRFDEEYKCDLSELGSKYSKEKTVFRLWSPFTDEAYVDINNKHYQMLYQGFGIFECEILGDFEKCKYQYILKRENKLICLTDPFSYSNDKFNKYSYVIDPLKLNFENIKVEKKNNPIVYELSVRDFSSDIRAKFNNRSKFISFLEEMKYISSLGISHIQLMPIMNFDLDNSDYNWGYNPVDYNTFYWGYVVGEDPYSPIYEFRKLVDTFHLNKLKLILDVVYNHVYRVDDFSLNKLLPYYFFRYTNSGVVGNASYCGNETRSESYFLREYFKLINERLFSIYDIDGIRYDLMGILDRDTANYLYNSAKKIKSDILMLSEGWDMGDILPRDKRASIYNASYMINYYFFNSYFRDSLRGYNQKYKGYVLGNNDQKDNTISCIKGSYNFGLNEKQTINYVECHDNQTMYDKVSIFIDDEIIKGRICKLALGIIMISNGLPFIHAGQEFLRSKKGVDNSYNCDDSINKIDWELKDRNIETIEYFRKLIDFRNEYYIDNVCDFDIIKEENYILINNKYFEVIINNSNKDINYVSSREYKEVLLPDCRIINNIKYVIVPSFSLVIAKKD